jgi:hypothetical protein
VAATPVVERVSPPPDIALPPGLELTPQGRLKAPALSIADLIDNHVRLEWHEAVAIALHLCGVMSKEPGANVQRSLVEPWNVEITNSGEVHVLPGGSSSDPLVKQVGRVLRALLQDSIAPAELRGCLAGVLRRAVLFVGGRCRPRSGVSIGTAVLTRFARRSIAASRQNFPPMHRRNRLRR